METFMPTSREIVEVLARHREVLRALGVRRLALFGSVARGESTEASDLDFLVELDRRTFDGYMDVKEFLERLFQRPIDLVVSEALKPQLRPRILEEAIYAEGL
jgi:predicted nucleotidyltransferase